MSGSTPKVLSTATGVVLLPNTGGSRLVFWFAIAALVVGVTALTVSGVSALRQRKNRA